MGIGVSLGASIAKGEIILPVPAFLEKNIFFMEARLVILFVERHLGSSTWKNKNMFSKDLF